MPIGLLDDIPDASDDDQEGTDTATHNNSKVGIKKAPPSSKKLTKAPDSTVSGEHSDSSSEASAGEENAEEEEGGDQEGASSRNDDEASVNYDAIVEAQAQSRLQREVAAANAEELQKVTEARRARDKATLTAALEEFYEKYVGPSHSDAAL